MKKAKTEVIDFSSQPNSSRVSPILYAVHKQKKNNSSSTNQSCITGCKMQAREVTKYTTANYCTHEDTHACTIHETRNLWQAARKKWLRCQKQQQSLLHMKETDAPLSTSSPSSSVSWWHRSSHLTTSHSSLRCQCVSSACTLMASGYFVSNRFLFTCRFTSILCSRVITNK